MFPCECVRPTRCRIGRSVMAWAAGHAANDSWTKGQVEERGRRSACPLGGRRFVNRALPARNSNESVMQHVCVIQGFKPDRRLTPASASSTAGASRGRTKTVRHYKVGADGGARAVPIAIAWRIRSRSIWNRPTASTSCLRPGILRRVNNAERDRTLSLRCRMCQSRRYKEGLAGPHNRSGKSFDFDEHPIGAGIRILMFCGISSLCRELYRRC